MRVNQAKAFKARGSGAKSVQRRDEDTFGIAQHNHTDFAPAGDQEAYLTVEGTGNN